MNQERYKQYVIAYVKEALSYGDNNADQAADYLQSLKKPGFLSNKEQKEAYVRTQKIFGAYRDRPLWFVLKCLGITQDELE